MGTPGKACDEHRGEQKNGMRKENRIPFFLLLSRLISRQGKRPGLRTTVIIAINPPTKPTIGQARHVSHGQDYQ